MFNIYTLVSVAKNSKVYSIKYLSYTVFELTVAEFIVPEWRPGGPVRKPSAGVNFISPVSDYEFGYSTVITMHD
jgi:hypothetical protein